jgi:photosystem II stability/assembly factor-like uncharacterized protein
MPVQRLRRVRQVLSLSAVTFTLAAAVLAPETGAAAEAPPTWQLLATTASSRNYGPIACSGTERCVVPYSGRVGGGGVLVTSDGGGHWAAARLPGHAAYLGGATCASTKECLVAGYSGDLATRSAGVAFRTLDGGRSWTQLSLPAAVGPGRGSQLFAVACHGASFCAAIGAGRPPASGATTSCGPGCVASGAAATYGLVALESFDGGARWSTAAVRVPAGTQLNSLACASAGSCQAVGFSFSTCRPVKEGHGATCTPGATAVGSRRGGAVWAAEPVGGGIFNLYGVSCPTPAQCWASGSSGNDVQGHGVLVHTADGGARWARQAPAAGSNSLTDLSCPTVHFCAAAGALGTPAHLTPVVETTSNGGARWSIESVPAALSQVVFITCPAPGRCLAKGIEGYGQGERFVLLRD